jgi:hypothetical protein
MAAPSEFLSILGRSRIHFEDSRFNISLVAATSTRIQSEDVLHGAHVIHEMLTKMAPECSHMITICHFPFWLKPICDKFNLEALTQLLSTK